MALFTPSLLWENYDRFIDSKPVYLESGDGSFGVYFGGARGTRVYGRLTLPKGKAKPPVILLLLSAAQTVEEVDTAQFLEWGYAVFAVDYVGDPNAAHYTKYPQQILPFVDPKLKDIPPQNSKDSLWYYWTTCAIHAATFLENCEYVDGQSIGIIGVGEGASIAIKSSLLIDVKAAMTFFCGDLTGSGEEFINYRSSLDSRVYNKIKFPVMINATTNEKNGGFDYLNELYQGLDNACFSALERADRSISNAQRANIKIWFDRYFFGAETEIEKPQINLFYSEGSLYAELNSVGESVNIYAAEDNSPAKRNWNNMPYSRVGDSKYLAKIDFCSERNMLVYASVKCADGLTLSTPVLTRPPQKLTELKTSRLIYNCDEKADVFMRENGTFFEDKSIEIREGLRGLSGVFGNVIKTFRPGESRFSADSDSLLQIILYSPESNVEIKLEDETEYSCTKILEANEWNTVTLSKDDFKNIGGCPSFDRIVSIGIEGKNIIVNSILWV